ncbi:MAG TPA: hypothetical protein VG223_01545 [Solirubrobacteraceae bacterium]|nr:hypothetical protein [Solirubrobacteraceae bacterium]
MSGHQNLLGFLRTDPDEAACAEVFSIIEVYVERELAYGDAAVRYPRIAAHLQFCEPCRLDFDGLMRIARTG